MRFSWFTIATSFLVCCNVLSQQQTGLVNLLATLLVNNGTTTELSQTAQQQQGLVNILTTLLANNEAALALQQGPELAANFAGLLNYLNTTGNITGVINNLATDSQVSSITTTLVTLLFESLSLTVLTNNRVSDACQTDMIIYIEELIRGSQWALRMIDATGKPGSDLADGLTKFIGSYEECVSIQAVSYSPNDNGTPRIRGSFGGKYCSAFFDIPGIPPELVESGAGYMQLGVCVPDTCIQTDVQILVAIVERAIFNRSVLYPPTVHCQEAKEDVGVDVIVCIGILSIIGCLVVMGTLYDIVSIQNNCTNSPRYTECEEASHTEKNYYVLNREVDRNNVTQSTEIRSKQADLKSIGLNTLEDGKGQNSLKNHQTENRKEEIGTMVRSLLAFSIYSNTIKMLKTGTPGPFSCLHGIRVLTVGWIMLVHTLFLSPTYDANVAQFGLQKMNNWTLMLITYAGFGVDTFFAISGLLVAYFVLKQLEKKGSPLKLNWGMFYVHRFIRITPTYMLVLMIGTVLIPRLFYGPLWNNEALGDMKYCRKNWWTNLLYVNNYVRVDEMCMGWSWYLSADMQMYVVSPLFIILLFYNFVVGSILCVALVVGTMVATGIVTYNGKYPVQQLLIPYMTDINMDGYYEDLYNPFHMRIGPYIVGMLTGYLLYRWKCTVRMPKILNLFGWFMSISLSLVLIYVRYSYEDDRIFSRLDSAIFMAVHRVLWGTVPCWVIFSCATAHGGWINRLLSWKAFVPLGRLSFCVYLIHPIVIQVFYASRMVTTYFTEYEVIYLFLGHTTLSFGVAFALSTAFEMPVAALEKILF